MAGYRFMQIIGRIDEQEVLAAKIDSGEAELIAIYGRRRVGKTYLIRTFCSDKIVFEFIGIHDATMQVQLQNFSLALQKSARSTIAFATPENWVKAFSMLDAFLDNLASNKPAVVFLDEFPWINTRKSGFLQAFDHWWNVSASRKNHLKVIICGSAASWMIENIINNRGGLHNRVTQTIRLLPFTLGETEQYLSARKIVLDRYQVLQIYMAMGGIPHYLKDLNTGESTVQIIDRLCFTKDGILKQEFDKLYQSLFANSENHIAVVRALARKGKGLTRNEIIAACGFTSGGTTTRILKELEESGFITPYLAFQKSENESIYKLSDEYSLFYIKFIEKPKDTGKGAWLKQSGTASYLSWTGFAFESVCQKHTTQIKRALGIEGVLTHLSGWRYVPDKGEQGAQIDLLIDRQDRCINICEIKFTTAEFVIDKKYAGEIDIKLNVFRTRTKTRKTLFPTMITTFGTKKNEYYLGRIQNEVVMNDLFY
ncbi:AAA family ATPase [Flavitalea sp.]|nr:ATP-binding protein [Flavitalea sp.]